MVILALAAPEFVRAILTSKWDDSIPYLQLLCVAGLLYPLHSVNLSVIVASGQGALFLRLEVIKKLLLLLVLLSTFRLGVMAMTYGLVGHSVLAYGINAIGPRRNLGYSWMEQARDILPFLVCSLLAGAAGWGISEICHGGVWTALGVKVGSSVMCYTGLLLLGRNMIFETEITTLQVGLRHVTAMIRR